MAAPERLLVVSLDTEVDKDARWNVSEPATFASTREGIPGVLSPLFDRHGIVPTYLLSPEVIEDDRSVDVLLSLGSRAELGTHLHAEFAEPERTLRAATMAGQPTTALQCALAPAVEEAKLAWLTELFGERFGVAPTAFRAGRYAIGPHTLEVLARLGYRVDSSVTPGVRWRYAEGTVDHRDRPAEPEVVQTRGGPIVELPVGVRAGRVAQRLAEVGGPAGRAARRLLGPAARQQWLRPSWLDGPELIEYVERHHDRTLVLMLHSMEIVAGASPYAADRAGVRRIVRAMDELFEHCIRRGIRPCGMTEAARHVSGAA